MARYYRNTRKPAGRTKKAVPTAKPIEDRRLVVRDNGPGEDLSVYEVDVAHPWDAEDLRAGKIRLFDSARDDRGPEVAVTFTYGLREGTWFPKTEGQYLLTWVEPDKAKRPEAVRNVGLHFGDVSSPQPTKAVIHRLYLDMVAKNPALAGQLKVIKRPCVFCRDSALAPGGSTVEVPMDALPPPAPTSMITRFYM